ncbi:hypothetical protein OU426_09185 [Frigidibacter sp. RF13]|uniref:hypothetical protein n=1 Tax=Frigidibacter sp. RF13 TaxID=2997340 RepID=UPI002270A1AE|nr:hypothetical protein [Frigidibacter sp. RF13]MCY1127028.1 hypothetical protein [Frigidibacter sp. RF13]
MALQVEHELHRRRFGRNIALGAALGAFVLLVFVLTIVKVSRQDEHGNPPGMVSTTEAGQ